MKKIVTTEISSKLKELGFDGTLYQQVIDWFIENYNIYISIVPHGENEHALKVKYSTSTLVHGGYDTFEEACDQAILKSIDIINKKN